MEMLMRLLTVMKARSRVIVSAANKQQQHQFNMSPKREQLTWTTNSPTRVV